MTCNGQSQQDLLVESIDAEREITQKIQHSKNNSHQFAREDDKNIQPNTFIQLKVKKSKALKKTKLAPIKPDISKRHKVKK